MIDLAKTLKTSKQNLLADSITKKGMRELNPEELELVSGAGGSVSILWGALSIKWK